LGLAIYIEAWRLGWVYFVHFGSACIDIIFILSEQAFLIFCTMYFSIPILILTLNCKSIEEYVKHCQYYTDKIHLLLSFYECCGPQDHDLKTTKFCPHCGERLHSNNQFNSIV
jgi:uncharacterized paraquat-inducible protein A